MARLTDLKVDRNLSATKVAPARKGPALWARPAQYLHDVRAELARVDWPTRPELIASTIVVIVVLVAMTIYLGAWDLLFNKLYLLLSEKVRGR